MTTPAQSTPRSASDLTDTLAIVITVCTVIAVAFRIPGALFLVLSGSFVQLLILRWKRPDPVSLLWLVTMTVATGAACLGVIFTPSQDGLANFATITLAFLLQSLAILATTTGDRLAKAAMTTAYWCFGAVLAVGVGELITGFNLRVILYPEEHPPTGPFDFSAFYPNYNDFSVVITMFATMSLVRLLFDHRSAWQSALLCGAVGGTASLIFLQGSRGALLGLLGGGVLALWMNLRIFVSTWRMTLWTVMGLLVAAAAGTALWNSPWAQDNSTFVRFQVMERILTIRSGLTPEYWFGWGSESAYKNISRTEFGGELTDPHNVFLEAFIWYGLPAAILFFLCVLQVLARGVWMMQVDLNWRHLSAVLLVALIPVLGVVPSSTFRYYFIFLFSAAAAAALSSWRRP